MIFVKNCIVSRDTCFVLGAVFGAAAVYFTPFRASVINGDDNMKKDASKNGHSQSVNNKSDRRKNSGKREKFYGDTTMSDILKTAKSEFLKIWSFDWKIIIPDGESSTFETARSNLSNSGDSGTHLQPNDLNSGMCMPNESIGNSGSTVYKNFGSAGTLGQPAEKKTKKNIIKEIYKGIKRSFTSRNDTICKNFPQQSTLLEPPQKKQRLVPFGDTTVDELSKIAAELEATEESSKQNRLVVNLKRSVSPLQKLDQNLRNMLSSRKKAHQQNEDEITHL